MIHTVKGTEGAMHFMTTYGFERELREIPRDISFEFAKTLFIRGGMAVSEGDEVHFIIDDQTRITRQGVSSEVKYNAEKHDSFLLKLVKQ